mgnify:CR=1 FL=1|tara:strand:+ start:3281 stop:4099 length:819 start_codon:yes stop_codon:yes gene_type:complete
MTHIKDVLESHSLSQLRKMVKVMNVPNYIKIKGKDVKVSKEELIERMAEHYQLTTKDGQDALTRTKKLPKTSGVLGAIRDKKELWEEIDAIDDMTMKEKKSMYNHQLKIEQEEGRIHKGKRIIKDKKGKMVMIKKPKGKAKAKTNEELFNEDLEEHKSKTMTLSNLVKHMEQLATVSKKKYKELVDGDVDGTPHDYITSFRSQFNKNNEFIENNIDHPDIGEHVEEYADLLKRAHKATKGKVKRGRFNMEDQEGLGLSKILTGTLGVLSNLF